MSLKFNNIPVLFVVTVTVYNFVRSTALLRSFTALFSSFLNTVLMNDVSIFQQYWCLQISLLFFMIFFSSFLNFDFMYLSVSIEFSHVDKVFKSLGTWYFTISLAWTATSPPLSQLFYNILLYNYYIFILYYNYDIAIEVSVVPCTSQQGTLYDPKITSKIRV